MSTRTTRLALAVLAAATAVATTATPAAAEPLNYVALGDSYAAGSGVLPIAPGSPLLCLQSAKNYAKVIAGATGATLTDVTCGAAETRHFTTAQYPGLRPQLDAVTADTDLVTVNIGGNDNSVFATAVLACGSAGLLTLGFGSPCKNTWGGHFTRQIEEKTYPAVKAALEGVHRKAPNARVAILGYPWIVPTEFDRPCFTKLPIARGDVPYMRAVQGRLNDVIARAAAETGSVFVDLAAVSNGRDACKPSGTRWVEPLFNVAELSIVHPNTRGEAGMAAEAMRVLGLG
ncbi:SGNH/GDSL hydrolase family protein [Actinokineospora guangxiensis]|uniref:SGNH/GDSL hydrolase family protein n=1 Tax=Actinokineospora guangxiensis TaxID=1490288 RepID=A0ABW0ENL9_9PSEU